MVPAALFPAIALIAGTAGGIAFHIPWRALLWLLPGLTLAASLAWRLRYPRATVSILLVAFGCCGFILGSHAGEAAVDTPREDGESQPGNAADDRGRGDRLAGRAIADIEVAGDASSP